MPELINIGPETETKEYKKSTGEMKEAIFSITAILNKHQKGELYFGVKNDGTVIGQEITDESLRKISQAIGNHVTPSIYPEIKVEEYGGRKCISVRFEGTRRPYLAYNVPRIRVADEDLVMDQAEYERMMQKRNSVEYSWERKLSKYTIADVNKEVFEDYLRRAKEAGRIEFDDTDMETVLIRLGLLEQGYLLNAGAALFCDSGLNELQMAKFASNERLTFTDIRRFTGPVLDLIKKAEQYIIDAMDWRVEIGEGLSRKEIPEIPLEAIREAIINSFGHKLFESGQSNEVAVFKNRIEVYSPGRFPDGVTPETFIEGKSRPIRRNPLITRTLYYSKDMESFATGLKRIQNACDKVGNKVAFEEQPYGFAVIFYRKEPNILGIDTQDNTQDDTQDDTQNDTQDDIQDKILLFCAEPHSKKEIAEFLGYKSVKSISKRISLLLERKMLLMTIPEKPNSKHQKYVSAHKS